MEDRRLGATLRPIIQSEVRPFRGLLLGFFFISVGLSIDLRLLATDWSWVLGLVIAMIALKALLNGIAAAIFRWSVPGSLQLGLLLAQGSEFAFLIFSLPQVRALVGERASGTLIAAVALSLALTPTLAQVGRQLAGRLRRMQPKEQDPELQPREFAAPVFIAGMGRRGRAVADAMTAFGIDYIAIERTQSVLQVATADGYNVLFGDFSDPRIWDPVALEGRKVTILTAPDLEVSSSLTPMARRYFPHLKRFAIVADMTEAASFAAAGLTPVIDDPAAPGVEAAALVLGELGIEQPKIGEWLRQRQARESGGPEVPIGTPASARSVPA